MPISPSVHAAVRELADQPLVRMLDADLIATTEDLYKLMTQINAQALRCLAEIEDSDLAPDAGSVRRMACDAAIIPIVLGSHSEILDIGRRTRTVPAGIRRALNLRDQGCAFPGCDRPPSWTDAHHTRHWSQGGKTALPNLVLLCEHHHTTIHHRG